jgi:iron complex outermembrane receptor protein
MMGASVSLMLLAASTAHAADAAAAAAPTAPNMTSAGGEGTDVEQIVITAEANRAAAQAPAKASLDQVQPESIISHQYIQQAVSAVGDYTDVALIAPSVAGIGSNGVGIGDYNKITMRGFQDGQYNVTYDGISFGDTNDPTHHPDDYFPTSTIGAMVVDRGPGAAGDLGQANFGGALHMFSPTVSDTFGVTQQITGGSFDTVNLVTTINTGASSSGAKLLLNFNELHSNGELSYAGGDMSNQLAKFVMPMGPNWTLTAFGVRQYVRFNFEDSAGPGETWQQEQAYGKNFYMTNIPGDEHNYKWNYEGKATDFEYVDLKGTVMSGLTAEDQLYTYFYANKTTSTNGMGDLIGAVPGSAGYTSGINTVTKSLGEASTDIGGYDKLNQYRVWGNVVRINKDWSFGTLKVGGLTEISSTDRHNILLDFTDNFQPDLKFAAPKYNVPSPTDAKLQENSKWFQYQVFADFELRIGDNLKLTPGIKFVNFTRNVDAADENVASASGTSKNEALSSPSGGYLQNTFSSPLYFFTANYKVTKDWAFYGQVATSFLIPDLASLYVSGANTQNVQPEKTLTYQVGTVYTHGNITADFDVYEVDASNFETACSIPDPTNPGVTISEFCNLGKARYNGFEGEVAYSLPQGFSLFANYSSNVSKTEATAGNAAEGIAPAVASAVANAPRYTAAGGVIYSQGPWAGTLTYKQVGAYSSNGPSTPYLPGYGTFNGSAARDFGRFALKLQVMNMLDKRDVTSFNGGAGSKLYDATSAGNANFYTFQSGRTVMGTLTAKF